ncbi:MAG: nucleotide exchange factor GrpE [Deltaproteobacteria bacterium]|nr:nucleotide exchange factor GrpE [Deltaproteobacteria bacterium]
MAEDKDDIAVNSEQSSAEERRGVSSKKQEQTRKTEEKPLEKLTKAELIQKVKSLQEEVQKQYELYLRSQAEIENIKKRTAKEKQEWVKYANETLIKDVLPVMDNLEKAISHSQNEASLEALREGVELTLKGLKDTLKKSGLEEIKAVGEKFDPSFHEAVSEAEDENLKPGTVVHELQKGYILNNRLIRPSMVVVSKSGSSNRDSDDKEPERVSEGI